MSDKRKLLVQLDTDAQASLFDRIVAFDAGADEVLSYSAVRLEQMSRFVQDGLFTRHPKDLPHTALYVGGSDVVLGDALFAAGRAAMLPQFKLQVSMMVDSNGCNTTAVAAVRCAAAHLRLASCRALVLGGAGRVGSRIVALLRQAGAQVVIADPLHEGTSPPLDKATAGQEVVISAGPPATSLLPQAIWEAAPPKVLIDLNAVPPLGVEGVAVSDRAKERAGAICYGALGVGDLKMRLHKHAIAQLFVRNDQAFDLAGIDRLAGELLDSAGIA